MALLSTAIPLTMTLTATLVAVNPDATYTTDPSVQQVKLASSVHVLAFSSHGVLLVAESEGDFTVDIWEEAHQKAKLHCHGESDEESESEDVSMTSDDGFKLESVLKDVVERKIAEERKWEDRNG